ncbi:MAG: HipA family kinase [Candidatus Acidiferrum sp.]
MPKALEQIRRMRGGAQSHLMRCADGHYYVVKFQNNPQHRRILVNELLGTRLASRLGLPTTPVAIIEVSEELIRLTPDLAMEHPRQRIPCHAGLQFGSRYPGDPRRLTLHDFLPDEQLRRVENLHDFAGMLVFDKWTCNTNGRQTLFLSDAGSAYAGAATPVAGAASATGADTGYRTFMIDQGFCFSAGDWKFPDAPLRGLYSRNRVYEGITGMQSFGPWLERLEQRITERVLDDVSRDIPSEWYGDEYDDLLRMLEQLFRRRARVPELLLDAKKSNRQPFPNWVRA